MHRRVYTPLSDSYSQVNYLHNIKLNPGDLFNLCSPHISSAPVHTGMS